MSKIIIGAIVGAIIGYITNYIAIKMLFKPHTEKRILGIKIPFTPGLIPKEKKRIAKSVGETIAEHLLNGDILQSELKGDKIKKYINKNIDKKITSVLNSDTKIKDIYTNVFKKDFNLFKQAIVEKLYGSILLKIKSNFIKTKTFNALKGNINSLLEEKPTYLLNILDNEVFKGKINFCIKNLKNNTKEKIQQYILSFTNDLQNNDKKISDVIPKEVVDLIYNFIYKEKEDICKNIYSMFLKEDVSDEIKKAIKDNVLSNVNPLISMFLNVDSLYEKFINILNVYLSNEQNQLKVISLINDQLKDISQRKLNDLLNNISESDKNSLLSKFTNILIDKIQESKISDVILDYLKDKLNICCSYREILSYLSINYNQLLDIYLEKIYIKIVNDKEFEFNLYNLIDDIVDNLFNNSFKDLSINNKELITTNISLLLEDKYNDLVDKNIENILQVFNISEIVENQINGFEVDYAERIILNIANKELKAITWLGALLGGILGIITPILSKFY